MKDTGTDIMIAIRPEAAEYIRKRGGKVQLVLSRKVSSC